MPSKIKKRGENSYLLTVTKGYDQFGRQISYTKTVNAANRREAEKKHSLFVAEVEQGQISTSGRMTLKDFFDYWMENYAEAHHAPRTQEYNRGLFKRIEIALGQIRLDKLSPKHLLEFYKNLAEAGIRIDPNAERRKEEPKNIKIKDTLSPNTIRKYHVLLHSLLEKAYKWQFIAFNPADKVEAPKVERFQKSIYDEDTLGRFLVLLDKEELKHRSMALLLINTGMRRGELFGLQWKHVDFTAGSIKIEQSSQYLIGKGVSIKAPKTESSNRTVTIPKTIIDLLKQYKAAKMAKRLKLGGIVEQGGKWEGAKEPEDDFVFTTWNGQPAHPDSVNTWLANFIKENNLPPITPHSFRHIAATYLITSGTDIRTVAGKLGHANTNTTTVVYAHLLKSVEKETADIMEAFLKQAADKAKKKQTKQA